MRKLLFNITCILLFVGGLYFAYDSFFMLDQNKIPIKTPDFINKTYNEVMEISKRLNLSVEVVAKEHSTFPENHIYLQIPEAGKIIKNARTIKIAVSQGPYKLNLQNFQGLNLKEAKRESNNMSLAIRNITYVKHDLPFNTVITTYPSNNEDLYIKKSISFLVSAGLGTTLVKMPSLIGLNYSYAVDLLNMFEIISNNPRYVENNSLLEGTVIYQSFPPYKFLLSGSTIELTISKKK